MAQEQMNDIVKVEIDKARELVESYEKRTKRSILFIIIIIIINFLLLLLLLLL